MGHNPEWGFSLVLYFFLGGIAAGAYFIAALADALGDEGDKPIVRVGYLLAFPLTMILPILLVIDLGMPLRAFNMFLAFKLASPMSVGSWALLAFGVFTLASWWLTLKEDKIANAAALRRKIGFAGALFGFFIASYTGVLLGTTTRPFWGGSHLIGALFLVSAASTAIAAISLILSQQGLLGKKIWGRLRSFDEVVILLEVILIAAFLGVMDDASSIVVTGRYALAFWSFIIFGLVVPFALQFGMTFFSNRVQATKGTVTAATLLLLFGGLLLRYVIVAAGQA